MNSGGLKAFIMQVAVELESYTDDGTMNWQSSALDLENELKQRGITDVKLYHRYKLPGNASPEIYMIKNALRNFYIRMYEKDFSFLRIFNDHMTKIKDETQREKIKQEIIKEVQSKKDEIENYKKERDSDYEELLKLNPDLPRVQDKFYNSMVIDGAIFGFGQDDIKYFIKKFEDGHSVDEDEKKREQLYNTICNDYGIRIIYLVAPETAEKIFSALEQKKSNRNSRFGFLRRIFPYTKS